MFTIQTHPSVPEFDLEVMNQALFEMLSDGCEKESSIRHIVANYVPTGVSTVQSLTD